MDGFLDALEPPADRPGTIPAAPDFDIHDCGTPETRMLKDGDFDWAGDDSVILQEQLAMAVYRNRADGVVIRQERNGFDEDDHFVVIRDEQALRVLIAALQRELKGGGR